MIEINDSILSKVKRIHLVGIGGSGMAPLAEILHHNGYILTGSDVNEGDTLDRIKSLGIPVYMGHKSENIGNAQLVVYTAAVKKDNIELTEATKKGIPIMDRATLMGIVSRKYKNTIAVSGTHGKTTVTSMIVQILVEAELDPSAVIGGKLPLINSNGRVGNSDIFVCEACEFVDTFLQLSPNTSIILNIDADHLDYFGTLENVIDSFRKFALKTSDTIIINQDDENTLKAINGIDKGIVSFGLSEESQCRATNISIGENDCPEFDIIYQEENKGRIQLSTPGTHNIYNALAAAVTALRQGVSFDIIAKALNNFKGATRRFEILGKLHGITIADDYAHHPKELEVTLKAAKQMNFNKVWAVFQPFTYSRTAHFLDDFAKVLKIADRVVMSEIMGGRETNTYNIYTKDLADKIDGSVWFNSFEEISDYIVDNAQSGDLVITLGCGDIYKAAKMMVKKLKDKA